MKRFYLAATIIGAALPLYYFDNYFIEHGFDVPGFLSAAFANKVSTGLTADLLISALVALIFIGRDAGQRGIRRVWLFVAATCLVGLSFALPLYLYMREGRTGERQGADLRAGALSPGR